MKSRSTGFAVLLVTTVMLAWPTPAWAASPAVQVIVPIAFFACVAVVVALLVIGHHRLTVQRHETMRAMVEKGMEIPPGLLGAGSRPPSPRTDLRRGILLICAGLGIGLFLLFEEGRSEAMLGFIPAIVGVGYLIVAKIESSRAGEQTASP
jgi:hypothetical protein